MGANIPAEVEEKAYVTTMKNQIEVLATTDIHLARVISEMWEAGFATIDADWDRQEATFKR